jgi:hypothetical protein
MVPSFSSHPKAVYTPRGVVPHAALLGQACAHCRKSLAAATRRCGGRVSVPLWLIVLSDQLPIVALVGRHPANQLIGRNPLPRHPPKWVFLGHPTGNRVYAVLSAVSRRYPPPEGRSVTRSAPVRHYPPPKGRAVRLACVRHAASVDPEPGSNSPPEYTSQGRGTAASAPRSGAAQPACPGWHVRTSQSSPADATTSRARPTPHLLNVPPRLAQRAIRHGCVNRTTVRATDARVGPGSVLGASVVRVCRSVSAGAKLTPVSGGKGDPTATVRSCQGFAPGNFSRSELGNKRSGRARSRVLLVTRSAALDCAW